MPADFAACINTFEQYSRKSKKMKFELNDQEPNPFTKKISRTYRLKPETLFLIQEALPKTRFQTATSFVEEAASQFAEYILTRDHEYKKSSNNDE